MFKYFIDVYIQYIIRLYQPREGGDIELFIKLVPKVLLICFLIRWVDTFGDFYQILICWLIELSVQKFKPPVIVIYRRSNLVYHHWRYTSIYWPLFYPFRYLIITIFKLIKAIIIFVSQYIHSK